MALAVAVVVVGGGRGRGGEDAALTSLSSPELVTLGQLLTGPPTCLQTRRRISSNFGMRLAGS